MKVVIRFFCLSQQWGHSCLGGLFFTPVMLKLHQSCIAGIKNTTKGRQKTKTNRISAKQFLTNKTHTKSNDSNFFHKSHGAIHMLLKCMLCEVSQFWPLLSWTVVYWLHPTGDCASEFKKKRFLFQLENFLRVLTACNLQSFDLWPIWPLFFFFFAFLIWIGLFVQLSFFWLWGETGSKSTDRRSDSTHTTG